jgi:hypothetical protein
LKSKATSAGKCTTSSSVTVVPQINVEVSLDSPYRYNPLHNDLDAYALAYGIATLMTNLFDTGQEPFWQQASTNLVKFVILLHQTLDNYMTLFQVVCDEYQAFATTGENEPSGDDKFFSLARQARCIPLAATQSISSLRSALTGESWRTLHHGCARTSF